MTEAPHDELEEEDRGSQGILHMTYLLDCSSSMGDAGKIQALNTAMEDLVPLIEKHRDDEAPGREIMMRIVKFSSGAEWHATGSDGVPIDKFTYPPLKAGGSTSTAQAIKLIAGVLKKTEKIRIRPVVILISDGACTEPQEDYDTAIKTLNSFPVGKSSSKLAIMIDSETSDYESDRNSLIEFTGHQELVYDVEVDENDPQSLENLVEEIKMRSMTTLNDALSARRSIVSYNDGGAELDDTVSGFVVEDGND